MVAASKQAEIDIVFIQTQPLEWLHLPRIWYDYGKTMSNMCTYIYVYTSLSDSLLRVTGMERHVIIQRLIGGAEVLACPCHVCVCVMTNYKGLPDGYMIYIFMMSAPSALQIWHGQSTLWHEQRTKPITSAKGRGWNGHRFLCVPHRSWGFNVCNKIRQTCVSKVIVFCVTPIVPEGFMIVSSINVLVWLFQNVGGFGGRSHG